MDRYNLEMAMGFIESHLDAAARELEMQPPESAAALIRAIPLTHGQRLITQMLPVYAGRIVAKLETEVAAPMLAAGNSNQVASILRHLPSPERSAILKLMPDHLAMKCRRILQHPENSVGAWMNADALVLPENITASDALHRVADARDLGDGNAIPLVSESQQLIGYVSVRDLLRARSETVIIRLRRELEPVVISSKMSLHNIERHPGWQHHDNLIVVNQRGQVEGLLRHASLRKGLHLATLGASTRNIDNQIADGLGQVYLHTLVSIFSLISGDSTARQAASQPYRSAGS
ncbi:MAG: CBS domain-containing protein [Gammaproteobacteria bacterium]|nr:CBS domain-containing protein [Gammaproteobacteria bacterium]